MITMKLQLEADADELRRAINRLKAAQDEAERVALEAARENSRKQAGAALAKNDRLAAEKKADAL